MLAAEGTKRWPISEPETAAGEGREGQPRERGEAARVGG